MFSFKNGQKNSTYLNTPLNKGYDFLLGKESLCLELSIYITNRRDTTMTWHFFFFFFFAISLSSRNLQDNVWNMIWKMYHARAINIINMDWGRKKDHIGEKKKNCFLGISHTTVIIFSFFFFFFCFNPSLEANRSGSTLFAKTGQRKRVKKQLHKKQSLGKRSME